MFDSPMLIEPDERSDYGEDRWFGVGFLHNNIAVVIWTERQNDMNNNDLKTTPQTDWAALAAMTDEDIDYSDIPPLTEEFFQNATRPSPPTHST